MQWWRIKGVSSTSGGVEEKRVGCDFKQDDQERPHWQGYIWATVEGAAGLMSCVGVSQRV